MSGLEHVGAALAAVSVTEWVAAALALAYLLLAIRQDAWCWACAIASAVLYLVLFARAGLVMQAALQVFYIGMSVYGWRSWRGSEDAAPVAVQRWPWRRHALALAAVAGVTVLNVALVDRTAESSLLVRYADAGLAWASVLTTWMVARKLIENWLYWVAIDAASAVLYGSQALWVTAVLFALYAVLAVRGFREWRREAAATAPAPA